MHTRPSRDFAHSVTLHPQPNDLVMSRWAGAKNAFPELTSLRFLAGTGLCRVSQRLGWCVVQRMLSLQCPSMLLVTIGEPSSSDRAEKGLQLWPPGELTATVADASNKVGKHGLDDVARIHLGPEAGTESSPDRQPEERPIGQEHMFDGRDVTFVEPSYPWLQWLVQHDKSHKLTVSSSAGR